MAQWLRRSAAERKDMSMLPAVVAAFHGEAKSGNACFEIFGACHRDRQPVFVECMSSSPYESQRFIYWSNHKEFVGK